MTDPKHDDPFADTPADTDSETTEDTQVNPFADFLARTARETSDLDQYAQRIQDLLVAGLQESVTTATAQEPAVADHDFTVSAREVPRENRAAPEQGWRRVAVGLGPCTVIALINFEPGGVRYTIHGDANTAQGVIHGPTPHGVGDLLNDVKAALQRDLVKRRRHTPQSLPQT